MFFISIAQEFLEGQGFLLEASQSRSDNTLLGGTPLDRHQSGKVTSLITHNVHD